MTKAANLAAAANSTAGNITAAKVQNGGVTTNALAWVNFNGSDGSKNASYNVSSVTRTATGTYTVTMANAASDSNYVVLPAATATFQSGLAWNTSATVNSTSRTTTSFSVIGVPVGNTTSYSGQTFDNTAFFVGVFGN